MDGVGSVLRVPPGSTRWKDWRSCPSCFSKRWFAHHVVVHCGVAVGEGPDDVLEKPGCLLPNFEEDSENGSVLVLRVYTSEVFGSNSTADVMGKMFGGEVIYFH